MYTPQLLYEYQRLAGKHGFSPFTMWVPGIVLRSPGLAAGAINC